MLFSSQDAEGDVDDGSGRTVDTTPNKKIEIGFTTTHQHL